MGGIISFILAVEYGGQKKPWDSATVIGLFVGSVLIWVAFGIWEYFNNERAMLPRNLLRRRYVWQPSAFQFFIAAGYFVLLYYLPVYFQSVDNRSAINSGVLNLPLVLMMALGSTISGITVTKTGHAAPFMAIAAILCTISGGLIFTFDIGTSMGKWVGYQLIYGLAIGLGFQMGITIAQANAPLEEASSVTAIIMCKLDHQSSEYISWLINKTLVFQTIGGAFSISSAQSGFVNRLTSELARIAPEINPQMVVGTGATQIRRVFPADQIPQIVVAYMAGIKVALAISLGLTAFTCFIVAFVPRARLNAEALKNTGGGGA